MEELAAEQLVKKQEEVDVLLGLQVGVGCWPLWLDASVWGVCACVGMNL